MQVENIPAEVFSIGILRKDFHARLIANLEGVASQANIPEQFVWSRLSEFCTDEDVAWVRQMREDKDHGLVYVGNFDTPIEDRMMAIAGACLRNYIDARIMTVQQVIKAIKNDVAITATVLLIPNFCLGGKDGGDIPSWEISGLLGLLYSRLARNQKTVLYVASMETLEKNYGSAFRKHILAHYTTI